MKNKEIECNTCKRDAKVLGSLIVVPTILGISFAILLCYSSLYAKNNSMMSAYDYRMAVGGFYSAFELWCPICVGVSSLIVGLAGWFFIMRKKLYKCVQCSDMELRSKETI